MEKKSENKQSAVVELEILELEKRLAPNENGGGLLNGGTQGAEC